MRSIYDQACRCLSTFRVAKSHPSGVRPSGMLGRAVNAKHLRPGLPVPQHFSHCEKPPFGCPAFLPVPPSLPLGKRRCRLFVLQKKFCAFSGNFSSSRTIENSPNAKLAPRYAGAFFVSSARGRIPLLYKLSHQHMPHIHIITNLLSILFIKTSTR